MKIAVISTTIIKCFPPGYAGLEAISWYCAKGLAELGHQVTLVAPNDSECPGCEVIHTGPAGQHDEHSAFQIVWKRLFEFDCIVDHSWNKFAYTLKEEGVLKAPVIGVCHAPLATMYQQLPAIEKPCFVCISNDQAKVFDVQFDERECRVVRNGIDTDFYRPLRVPRSDRLLFLARFSSVKSPHLAIEACQKAGVGIDLIGDTTLTGEPEYLHRCLSMADGKQIRVLGGVARGETVWHYSQAHCMLHPTRDFREPLGLAPLESMAAGCPVIAWKRGALKETVVDGETGWLVKSVDQMADVIKGPARSIPDTMRTRCREWVCDNFSLKHMVDDYERVVQEAVNGGW